MAEIIPARQICAGKAGHFPVHQAVAAVEVFQAVVVEAVVEAVEADVTDKSEMKNCFTI